jgi:hypothetical protein
MAASDVNSDATIRASIAGSVFSAKSIENNHTVEPIQLFPEFVHIYNDFMRRVKAKISSEL